MITPYSSDISRSQFQRIQPLLEAAKKRTKPRSLDLYFSGKCFCAKNFCLKNVAVDTQGLPHAIHVSTANVTDRDGALEAIRVSNESLSEVINKCYQHTLFPKDLKQALTVSIYLHFPSANHRIYLKQKDLQKHMKPVQMLSRVFVY